ncbi:N-acetylneuraminate synthase/N,N'-diacetyllegionaminate synthase [Pedobacter steynii]|uniref:N-acetylneuraminate synthase/N,N'-diacetyllegionaminate synthase n=1 Tax=Pedobacter steynii TaxID=430522 RepID=A0A1G9WGQ5_9SPHI|nr:N-acetylneuraminate synthase [Pedobacter steynii]NQX40281.1 N-acetylneuraminate synthase [Pedobacter steynii]SDM83205.1 N-acetylneuraminate synthase/N,N'-diacetyllegionaminate synthase [Pedobacter steynii]
MSKILIIAEAGVNHNGDIEIAKRLINSAAEAGVDYVKFQTFKASKLVSQQAQKADYQNENTGNVKESQLQMLEKLELSREDHYTLIEYCKSKGVAFFSTAFDLDSLDFLNELGLGLFKVPSGEITNLPYLEKIAVLAKEVILSTGMCTMEEIGEAIAVLKGLSDAKITVLHCNTQYPTPYEDVNLLAMNEIKRVFGVDVGYSDHTLGIEVPIAAVALGATVIEKHFTLDRTLPGPDHAASLEPLELRDMVNAIRNIEQALGMEMKFPSASESKNIGVARKSIHLKVEKNKGEKIKEEDLEMLRPGDGISPMRMREIIGKTLNKDLKKGTKLSFQDIEG